MSTPQEGQATDRPADGSEATRRARARLLIGALVLAVVLLAGAVTVLVVGGEDGSVNEVFRQPAGAEGRDPFTESVAVPGQDEGVVAEHAGGSTAGTDLEVASVPGSQEGLYGGTQDQATCDREQLITFLEDNPDKASAWASVEGITTAEIPAFIRGLTPTRLRFDTRVTNHGYRDGHATAVQEVLQAGTAVLVDDHGLPRARCACGNPLLAPQPVSGASYRGPTWPGFNSQNIQVVISVQTVVQFVLVDVQTGGRFTRPVASDGSDDVPDGVGALEGTYSMSLGLTAGTGPGEHSYEETWVFHDGQVSVAFPDVIFIDELTFDAPVVQDGNNFHVNVVQADGSHVDLDGVVTNGGDDLQGTGAAGQGTALSTTIIRFTGHRTSTSTTGPASTTTTTTTTALDSSTGPPCTNEAVQQALAAGLISGTIDPDHAVRCEGGYAAAGILDPPYVASLVIVRADGDTWAVVGDPNQCSDRAIPYAIRVWGCNGDPLP